MTDHESNPNVFVDGNFVHHPPDASPNVLKQHLDKGHPGWEQLDSFPSKMTHEALHRMVLKRSTKMWALLTTQGTAIPETASCDEHKDTMAAQSIAVGTAHQFIEDWDRNEEFTDCTGNTELRCQICGAPDPDQEGPNWSGQGEIVVENEDHTSIPEDWRDRLRKPDGTKPTEEEIMLALYGTTAANENQMDCPKIDCGGHVEASAGIWFDISPEGVPYTASITWHEGGKIRCSRGGVEHIDQATIDRLWDTFAQYAATAEQRLGASQSEDALRDRWRLPGA